MATRKIILINNEQKPQGRPGEIWKPIPDFEGYEASDQGRVRSVDRKILCQNRHGHVEWRTYYGKVLSPSLGTNGYPHVQIGKGNNDYSGEDVHKLVMLAFVGPRPTPDHEIAHYDGNPSNNYLSNLSYKTYEEQYQDRVRHGRDNRGEKHYAAKLTESDVRAIRVSTETTASLARKYGMSKTTIHQIRNRLAWRWVDANSS